MIPYSFGKQMKAADKAGARYAVIIGDDELAKGVAKLKCLNSGDELEVPLGSLVEHLKGK
jgi:histidyl-tRNA synthetase